MLIRWKLTRGLRRLQRSTKLKRKILSQLPLNPKEKTEMPEALMGKRFPLSLKAETAMRMRVLLEDQVILQEQMMHRLYLMLNLFSVSRKKRLKNIRTASLSR